MIEVGIIGLGRMGLPMAKRLVAHGIATVVWNRSSEKVEEAVKSGALGSKSIAELVSKLSGSNRVVWIMLPSEVTEQAFSELLTLLHEGDIIIDGGNAHFADSRRRFAAAEQKGIHFLDVGVSGGVVGARDGYAVMAGGSRGAFYRCEPLFTALCQKEGYAFISEEPGSGHYTKMVHNAIEYGMMQAIAEGFDLLKNGSYEHLDLVRIAHLWNHGTIVQSFLMQMTEQALAKNSGLSTIEPYVDDNGEGRWAAIDAMENNIAFVANSYALHARYLSRDEQAFAFKMLAAMRNEFGGHAMKLRQE